MNNVSIIPMNGLPWVNPGDSISSLIIQNCREHEFRLAENDVVVIAQKIVSKAENRIVDLNDIQPSDFALRISEEISKDPRLVEVILSETKKIIRMDQRVKGKGRIIVETSGGIICANAGVDMSNVSGGECVTLLPVDSDSSASEIRNSIYSKMNVDVAVIITDTVGRPWRDGLIDIAIGCAGIKALNDQRGELDSRGLTLTATAMATADQIAAAAGLLMKKNSGTPVVIVRGLQYEKNGHGAFELIRKAHEDLFR